jgi:hypothetical protein
MHVPRALVILACAVVLVVGGAVAYAAIPSASGVFTACINKTSGAVRIIDTATSASCKSSEILRTWNQAGQPGAPGEDGEDVTLSQRYTAVGQPSTIIPDTPSRIVRTALCGVGDTVLDDQYSVNRLGGTVIDTLRVEQSIINSRFGKTLILETTTPFPTGPAGTTAGIDVVCLDTAAPFFPN